MSGRAVLSIAGSVVGAWVGGMVGMPMLGAAIGGQIGGAVGATFDPTQKIEGPRLGDLRLITSSYGSELPLVYGANNRVSGTVIWSSDLIETRKRKKTGGKGGGGGSSVTTYSYRTSAAVSLSEGPCKNIRRIWANAKIIFDINAIIEEVNALQAKATQLDADADAAEAAAAADPGNYELQLLAQDLRDKADAAAAAYTTAAANYGAAVAGDAPWILEQGSGMIKGPLGYLAFYPGNTTQLPDAKIEADLGAGNVPAYRGTCYVVIGDLQLADFGNSLPNLEFELDGLAPRTVGAILNDICARSGMTWDEYSVRSGLAPIEVEGYSVSKADNSMAAIIPLQGIYSFDTVEQGGEVRFVPRGLGPLSVIPLADIAARDRGDASQAPERFAVVRSPDFDLPKEISVTYRDPERDYQDNTQRAVRLFGDSYTVRSIQAPVVMAAADARKIADRLLWEAWSERLASKIEVSEKYRFLFPGDIIAMEVADTFLPFRVENRTKGANGLLSLEMKMEDPFVYAGSVLGQSAPTPINVFSSVGETFVAALNTPILNTDQTSTSFMWVLDAANNGWAGGAIYRSVDSAASFSEMASSGERNVTGTVASALPTGPADIWDRVNTITVVLLHDDHELESLPETDILNGKNAVWLGAADGSHGEVLQFATATLAAASPKTYVLSDLLRGRRATEHETTLHGANELFVYLEADLMRSADYDVTDWDRERQYKGVSIYQAEDDVLDYQTFVNLGERAMPRSPVHAIGTRNGSNDLTITWVRRIRGFQKGLGYGTLPLDETTELYEIDIVVSAVVVRTLVTAIPSVGPTIGYTAAQQTADGITPGDPVTIRIYQISAQRGRGHVGEFIV